jgi:hypothetical protein
MIEDRQSRIRRLEEELRARGAEFQVGPDLDKEMTESFLEEILSFERAPRRTLRQWLSEAGYAPPPMDSIAEPDLRSELDRFMDHLAFLRVYVEHTDHLDDRQLYTWLTDSSTLEIALPPPDSARAVHLNVIGGCSEEDNTIFLAHYAPAAERRHWKKEFPDEKLPARTPPPHHRDAGLPKAHADSSVSDV